MLAMTLGDGSATDFGASQCIPMGPCHLTRRLTLGVVMPLTTETKISCNVILWFSRVMSGKYCVKLNACKSAVSLMHSEVKAV